MWQLLLLQKLSIQNHFCFNYIFHSQGGFSSFLIWLVFMKYLGLGSMNSWNYTADYLMIFAYILKHLWSQWVKGMKILTGFKFIWLIHSEGQVQKVFITMDRLEEIKLLECLIMAQHPKTKIITEVTMHLKYSWIK